MDNWTAFFCGLILGSDNKNTHHYYGPKTQRNIALQDIAFCQALRNCIDRLDSFVQTTNPTPQQFIARFYPDYHFNEPFTSEEQKKINDREIGIRDYLSWVKDIGEEKWCSLSTIEKIWQTTDLTYVPDPDNLDLLFALETYAKPVKRNGRLYEYEPVQVNNAKCFFDKKLAHLLYVKCVDAAESLLAQKGFDYDYTRFEHNRIIDTNKRLSTDEWKKKKREWQIDCREKEYLNLLKTMPSFVANPWSHMTRELKKQFSIEEEFKQLTIDDSEMNRRDKELQEIYENLTSFQKNRMADEAPKLERKSNVFFGVLCCIPVLWFIIALVIGANMGYAEKKEFDNTSLLILLALIVMVGLYYGFDKLFWSRKQSIYAYLRIRQRAYYSNSEHTDYKKEYEELLGQRKVFK